MKNTLIALTLGLSLAISPVSAHAQIFGKSIEEKAADAASKNLPAVTIWVDASWGFRTQSAANNITRAHSAFAKYGYKVISVESYIENGDLEGFFVTYQKA